MIEIENYEDDIEDSGLDELLIKHERISSQLQAIQMQIRQLDLERRNLKIRQNQLLTEIKKFSPMPNAIKKPADRVYAPLTLREKKAQVKDTNVGDGSVRIYKGRKQYWWRGGWRDY